MVIFQSGYDGYGLKIIHNPGANFFYLPQNIKKQI